MGSNELSTNPFDEDESYDAKVEKSFGDVRDISYHDIATKLLNDNLLLTALELHAELVENGKELPKLSIFFSNPGNFEQHTVPKAELLCSSIPRSSSQATLDSLDLTRYSEDGERGVDERVAVLEFELRKAKETINALRANLTVAIESDSSTPDGSGVKALGIEPVKPHEQRALNFLINEYLLYYGYKLTSITFSDENENQDFEDWDDVGLNIPKPAELLQLYRDFMRQSVILKPTGINVACQTITNHEEFNVVTARNHDQDLKHKRNISETLHDETAMLLEQIDGLRKEKQELNEKLWTLERLAYSIIEK